MSLDAVWRFLHLFFAFSYVGLLMLSERNGRAVLATNDWGQRALLLQVVQLSTRVAGLGGFIILGVFGNLLAMKSGYRMAADRWLMVVNTLWIANLVVLMFFTSPHIAQLSRIATAAARGEASEGWAMALGRWRFGNVVLSFLYVAFLALMVFRWRG
jgi:hypothetical protein